METKLFQLIMDLKKVNLISDLVEISFSAEDKIILRSYVDSFEISEWEYVIDYLSNNKISIKNKDDLLLWLNN